MAKHNRETPRFDAFDKSVLAVLGVVMVSALADGYLTTAPAGTYDNKTNSKTIESTPSAELISDQFQDSASGISLAFEAGALTAKYVKLHQSP